MPLSVHWERRKLHSSHIISLHSRASNALPGCLLQWTGTFNLYICQSVALCCCTPPPPQRSSQRSGRCTLGGGALHCARPRAECGRCVDAEGCNARKKLRLDHQSLQAAAQQQQHCNAAQCNASTDKAGAAAHLHMLLLLRHRHQLQHEADTACQTAGRLRMGLLFFEIDQWTPSKTSAQRILIWVLSSLCWENLDEQKQIALLWLIITPEPDLLSQVNFVGPAQPTDPDHPRDLCPLGKPWWHKKLLTAYLLWPNCIMEEKWKVACDVCKSTIF